MIPTIDSLSATPYDCRTSLGKPTFGGRRRQQHFQFTHDAARCNVTLEGIPLINGKRIVGAKTRTGEAVFLPWQEDKIVSVRLEAPLPSGGARFFYTSTMHGCRFFVDAIPDSKDVIVYHANAKKQDPGGGQHPNSQEPDCVNELRTLHNNAQREYGILRIKSVIEFGKQHYFAAANPIAALKQERVDRRKEKWDLGIRHRDVRWAGRCFVCGFPFGGEWQFYYQTWGEVTYVRPSGVGNVFKGLVTGHWKYLHKLRTRGSTEILSEMGVLTWGRIDSSPDT